MSTHDCAYIHFAFVHYAISIALVFGVVTCFSGVLGVACGALIAKRLRAFPKIGRTADPLVSAFGMFVAIPSMYLAFFIPTYSQSACFVSSIRMPFTFLLNCIDCQKRKYYSVGCSAFFFFGVYYLQLAILVGETAFCFTWTLVTEVVLVCPLLLQCTVLCLLSADHECRGVGVSYCILFYS